MPAITILLIKTPVVLQMRKINLELRKSV